jgi:predicted DNA-binding protein
VIRLLQRYLEIDNSNTAILVNGKWGSGKTYYIKEIFLKNITDREVYYISLFGVDSIQDIYKHIVAQKILSKQSDKLKKNSAVLLSTALKSGLNLLSKKFGLDLDKDFNLADFVSMNKSLIVFDDLERVSGKADLIELLGGISNSFLDNKNCKVIFIADESEIENDKFKLYKEKIISYTVQLDYNPGKTIKSIYSDYNNSELKALISNHEEFIINIFKSLKIKNYRTVKFALDSIEILIVHFKDDYPDCIKDILYSVIVLSIEEKSGRLSEIVDRNGIPDYISRERGKESIKLSNTENENYFNSYIVSQLRRDSNYDFSYYYSKSIFNLIHFGVYDPDGIDSDLKEINEFIRSNRKSEIYEVVEQLQGFVYMDNDEFVSTYTLLLKILERDENLSFQDLILSIKSICYLGRVPQLRIDPDAILSKFVDPHLTKLEGNDEEYYIPRLIISRLDRAIGDISRSNSDLAKRLDDKLKYYNDRYLYRQSKTEIDKRNWANVSEYNFRTYLNTASADELCTLVKSLENGNKSINEFTKLLEQTLKISINSYNEFSNEEVFASQLLECMVNLRSDFELVENYWLDQSIKSIEKFLEK